MVLVTTNETLKNPTEDLRTEGRATVHSRFCGTNTYLLMIPEDICWSVYLAQKVPFHFSESWKVIALSNKLNASHGLQGSLAGDLSKIDDGKRWDFPPLWSFTILSPLVAALFIQKFPRGRAISKSVLFYFSREQQGVFKYWRSCPHPMQSQYILQKLGLSCR